MIEGRFAKFLKQDYGDGNSMMKFAAHAFCCRMREQAAHFELFAKKASS